MKKTLLLTCLLILSFLLNSCVVKDNAIQIPATKNSGDVSINGVSGADSTPQVSDIQKESSVYESSTYSEMNPIFSGSSDTGASDDKASDPNSRNDAGPSSSQTGSSSATSIISTSSSSASSSTVTSGLDYTKNYLPSRYSGQYYFYFSYKDKCIYKVDLSDPYKKLQVLVETDFTTIYCQLWILNGWVYYEEEYSKGRRLSRVNINGNNPTQYYVQKYATRIINIQGSWIITEVYNQKADGYDLCFTSIDKSRTLSVFLGKQKIYNNWRPANGSVYYGLNNGYLYFYLCNTGFKRINYLTDAPELEDFSVPSPYTLVKVCPQTFYFEKLNDYGYYYSSTIGGTLDFVSFKDHIMYISFPYYQGYPVVFTNNYVSFVKEIQDSRGSRIECYRIAINIRTGEEIPLDDIYDQCKCDAEFDYLYYVVYPEDGGMGQLERYDLNTKVKVILPTSN